MARKFCRKPEQGESPFWGGEFGKALQMALGQV